MFKGKEVIPLHIEAESFGRCDITGEWSNGIVTSTYTALTFLPLNLYYQFLNFANIYFLVAGLLEIIPEISPSSGIPLTLIPLAFVLMSTGLKDAAQDIKKHKSDMAENSRLTLRLRRGLNPDSDTITDVVRWDELLVGDIVKVDRGQPFPADLILLLSSDATGVAYVETRDLDGETNLKAKGTHPEFSSRIQDGHQLSNSRVRIVYEVPNSSLYTFDGRMQFALLEAAETEVALSADQLLLRGSTLQTTKFVYGMVVYAGRHTRLFTNSADAAKSRYKTSKLMKAYSRHVLELFGYQLVVCSICAVAFDIYLANRNDWYFNICNL